MVRHYTTSAPGWQHHSVSLSRLGHVFANGAASSTELTSCPFAELHESGIRAYKVTPGSKGPDHPAVSVLRLPNLAKQSRLPFTGSEVSLQLLPTGEQSQLLLPGRAVSLRRELLDFEHTAS